MLKSMPDPVNEINCGLIAAESVSEMLPVRVPDEVGVKVTWMAQVPPFAATVAQLLVCAKSPVAWMLAIVRAPLPVLVTVMVCALLFVPTVRDAKLRLEALKLAVPARPVPLRVMMFGLP